MHGITGTRLACGFVVAAAVSITSADAAARLCAATPEKRAKSITSCMASSVPGDVILLSPGIYTDAANGGHETFPIQVKTGVAIVGYASNNTVIEAGDANALEGDSANVTIDNVTIKSNQRAVYLSTASGPGEFTITNSVLDGYLIVWNNDTAIHVDNIRITAPDFPISLAGTSQLRTTNISVSNVAVTSDNSLPYLPEGAIAARWADSVTISSAEVSNFYENFQIYGVNKLLVDNMTGVNSVNSGADTVVIRDSVFGLAGEGPFHNYGGAHKIMNSMLVGGTGNLTEGTVLSNCTDENLNPVSNVTYTANAEVPTASITALLARAQAGDTIKIPAGIYTDAANGGYETFPLQMRAGVSLVGDNAKNSIVYGNGSRLYLIEGDSSDINIENLTIESENGWPIRLNVMSSPAGAAVKNSIIKGLGGMVIRNDVAVTVDNCTVLARDGHISLSGSAGTNTLRAIVSNSTLSGTGATQTTGEAAISGGNGHSLSISNVTVTNMYENFQIGSYLNVMVDHLNGVNNVNYHTPGNLLIQNSKLGYLSNDGKGVLISHQGTTRVVNTMFVNGLQSVHGSTTLLNVYDENLDPVTIP